MLTQILHWDFLHICAWNFTRLSSLIKITIKPQYLSERNQCFSCFALFLFSAPLSLESELLLGQTMETKKKKSLLSFTPPNSSQMCASISEHRLLQNLLKWKPFCLRWETLQWLLHTIHIKSLSPTQISLQVYTSPWWLTTSVMKSKGFNRSHRQQTPSSTFLTFLSSC